MRLRTRIIVVGFVAVALLIVAVHFLSGLNFQVLNPRGTVARQERTLIYVALGLSLFVVLPVFGLTAGIAWRYRASNTKATYSPELDGNRVAETIWWLVPLALISILGVITYQSTHALDPAKALSSNVKPITIEVVALDWKWLFIYPEQKIATVNFVEFPAGTPVNFDITSDAPMNSFWIPQLGGQIYAMSGMSTQLHLMADAPGDFRGVSANISGRGFAGMKFTARAATNANFDAWMSTVKTSRYALTADAYTELARPSENNPVALYATSDTDLYDRIIMKYMMPNAEITSSTSAGASSSMPAMDMSGMDMSGATP